MTDEEFWAFVATLGGVAGEQSVTRLLAGLDDRAEDFQRRLDEAVRDLNRARCHGLPVSDVSGPGLRPG